MTGERFKHTSRSVPEWPPSIPGYVVLLTVICKGQETAHYCAREECQEICDLLSPHFATVERMLISGETMENVVARFQRVASAGAGAR